MLSIDRNGRDYVPTQRGHHHLPDHRWLEWVEFGDPGGAPIICFHGAPGSSAEAAMFGPAARVLGARILAISRPGFGTSSPQPGRRIADFATDVLDFADGQGLDQFGVIGYSAGAAYALSLAQQHPDRVQAVGLLAPAAPKALTGVEPGLTLPLLLSNVGVMALQITPLRSMASGIARRTSDLRGLPDASAEAFLTSLQSSFRQGPAPVAEDLLLVLEAWDFDPAQVPEHRVVIWQGRRDWSVPAAATEQFARAIPTAQLHVDEGASHFTVFTRHADELVDAVLHTLRRPDGGYTDAHLLPANESAP